MPVTRKTWSRETAALLLAVLCWTVYQENVPLVTAIIWPFTTYAAIAFGLKRADESGRLFGSESTEPSFGGWPQRSGEHTARPGERTDGGPQDFQRTDDSQTSSQRYHTDR